MKLNRAKHLKLGRRGETLAAKLLTAQGCELVAKNWRCAAGELDLVFRDGSTLVFTEVKTRRRLDGYRPGENLSPRQLKRNIAAAREFVRRGHLGSYRIRFDLVEVICGRFFLREIRHWRSFIPYTGDFR